MSHKKLLNMYQEKEKLLIIMLLNMSLSIFLKLFKKNILVKSIIYSIIEYVPVETIKERTEY